MSVARATCQAFAWPAGERARAWFGSGATCSAGTREPDWKGGGNAVDCTRSHAAARDGMIAQDVHLHVGVLQDGFQDVRNRQ